MRNVTLVPRQLVLCAVLCGSLAAQSSQIVFQPPAELFAGSGAQTGPWVTAIADVNGDGALDIVGVGDSSGSESSLVILGRGEGTFEAPLFFVPPGDPVDVDAGHLDQDPWADLAVATQIDLFHYSVWVLRGDGDGGFMPASEVWRRSFVSDVASALGDVDGDGVCDLVVAFSSAMPPIGGDPPFSTLELLLGNGDGTFEPPVTLGSASHVKGFRGVEVADLDGDGLDDIVSLDAMGPRLLVYRGVSGSLPTASALDFGPDLPPVFTEVTLRRQDPATPDLDGDGIREIVIALRGPDLEEYLLVFRTSGADPESYELVWVEAPQTSVFGITVNIWALESVQLDGQVGDELLVLGGASDYLVMAYRGGPLGSLELERALSSAENMSFLAVSSITGGLLAIGDLDGDGFDDAVVPHFNPFPGSIDRLLHIPNHTYAPDEPWIDLGHDLPGATAFPVLTASGTLLPGEDVSMVLHSATPGSTAFLVLGLSGVFLPFGGGTMVPFPDVLLVGSPVGPSGSIPVSGALPPGIPSGLEFWAQWWTIDAGAPTGFAASTAVRALVP